jgi:O-antigen/teichoic acid export membrane protein
VDFSKADPGPPGGAFAAGDPDDPFRDAAPRPDSWLRSGVSVLTGRGVDSILRFALFLATAKVLAPDQFNLYALVTAALATAQRVASFAAPRAALYFRSRENRGPLYTWLFLTAAAGSAAVLVFLAIAGPLRQTFFPGVSISLLFLGLSPLPFMLVSDSFSGVLLASGREKFYAATLWTRSLGIAAVLVTSFAASDRLAWLLWGRLVVNACVAALVLFGARARPAFREFGPLAREATRYVLPAAIGSGVVALHRRADVFLLAAFGHTAAIGGYALCYSVAEAFWLLTDSLEASLFVRLARRERGPASDLAREAFRRYRTVGLAAAAIVIVGGEALLIVMFGGRFPEAPKVFPWVLAGVVAWGITRPFESYLFSRRRTDAVLGSQIAGLLINVSLCAVLIPRFGAIGAGVASAGSYTLEGVIVAGLFRRLSSPDRKAA